MSRKQKRKVVEREPQPQAALRVTDHPVDPDAQKVLGPAHYGVGERAEVFMTPELLGRMESEALAQLTNTSTQPGIRRALLMPDGHVGYGCPVGTVAIADGWIYPPLAGFDIGCGMQVVTSSLDAGAIGQRDMQELMADISTHIAMGTGHGFGVLSAGELTRYLDGGIPAMVADGYATPDDITRTEEPLLQPTGRAHISDKAFERGLKTAGSLGGGNHFLEGQRIRVVDEELCTRWGLYNGQFVFQIHCGSRGLGHQVGDEYLKVAMAYMNAHGIPIAHRELVGMPLETPEGAAYLAAMYTAANFSTINRQLIMHYLREGVRRVFGGRYDEANLQLGLLYNTPHNVTRAEALTDGSTGIVHRKGATRACPAGHPRTPPAYQETGHPVLIPSAMGVPSYILVGLPSGAVSEYSVNHGAGRQLSRGQAKKRLEVGEVQRALGNVRINHQVRDVLDEAPQAYKPIDLIIDAVEQAGLARVVARLEPLFCMKGTG